jgi:hypothetical protein
MKLPMLLLWTVLGFLVGGLTSKERLMTPAVQREVERRLDQISSK